MKIPAVPVPSRLFDYVATRKAGEGALYIAGRFEEVVSGFPNFDKLDPFTTAMVSTTIDRDAVKHALGRLHGSQRMIKRLGHVPKHEFLGRVQSMMTRLGPSLKVLGEARGFLRRLPDPTAHYTICMAGFPNAGKTTLLKALTGSGAEIANYEFTTRALNYGTSEVNHYPLQIVDTPGTLNRPEKMNAIEKQAVIALAHLADAIVFVFDPMRDDESQELLFKTLEKYDVPLAIYASKQDLVQHVPAFTGRLAGKQSRIKAVPVFTTHKQVLDWAAPDVLRLAKEYT